MNEPSPRRTSAEDSPETLPRRTARPSERVLSAEFRIDAGRQRLELGGELDLETAPRFDQAMTIALAAARPIVIDLTRLRFIDSSGLWAITRAHSVCRRRGVTLTIAPGDGQVREILEATGLADVLPCEGLDRPG